MNVNLFVCMKDKVTTPLGSSIILNIGGAVKFNKNL